MGKIFKKTKKKMSNMKRAYNNRGFTFAWKESAILTGTAIIIRGVNRDKGPDGAAAQTYLIDVGGSRDDLRLEIRNSSPVFSGKGLKILNMSGEEITLAGIKIADT